MESTLVFDADGLSFSDISERLPEVLKSAPPLIKIKNLPVKKIDRQTPADWKDDCATPNDDLFIFISSIFGTVFGYSDLQEGRLVQEIFPIRRDANEQVGSGAIKLELHTEDPALEYRADFLGFMCISNIDRVPTIVSVPKLGQLSDDMIERLSRPVYRIHSDRPCNSGKKNKDLLTPVLFRDAQGILRFIYDPVYIDRDEMEQRYLEAFSALIELVEEGVTNFLLEPGEIGIIDNYQVAHGRPQYQPRYDGTDRWLKRTQISRNLDKYSDQAIIPGKLMP